MRFFKALATAAALVAFFVSGVLDAAPSSSAQVEAAYVVQYEPGAPRAALRQETGVRLDHGLRFARSFEVVTATPAEAAALSRRSGVKSVAPDGRVSAASNDEYFPYMWALENTGQFGGTPDADIDAPEAWQLATGAGVTVAVTDTCIDYTHPDLVGHYVGGWDFYDDDPDPGCAAVDSWHGTHVAGTVLATKDNGIGVAGVAPSAKLMALRVLGLDGYGVHSDTIDAWAYAAQHGAAVVNTSLGGSTPTDPGYGAVARTYPGTVFVAAAGNNNRSNDLTPDWPSGSDAPNVVSVAASDWLDLKSPVSNYGASTVDLAAPGEFIYSTYRNHLYNSGDGTSMASPHVAGAAALVVEELGLRGANVRNKLLASVDLKPAFTGITVSGGRLNAHRALIGVTPSPTTTTTSPPVSSTSTTTAPTSVPTTVATTTSTTVPPMSSTSTSTTTTLPPVSPVPTGVPGTWTLRFGDDFNGTALDLSKWSNCWFSPICGTQNNVVTSPANVRVAGGNLILTLASSTSGASVSSNPRGGAQVGYEFTYGAVEARIWFPGDGVNCYNWPAWWTTGQNWPTTGENDIAEVLAGKMTVNYHSSSGTHNQGPVPGYWCGGFHTYTLNRLPGRSDVYYDGQLVKSYPTDDGGAPHYVLVNIGVNFNSIRAFGAASEVKVDYIRAWTAGTPPTTTTTSTTSTTTSTTVPTTTVPCWPPNSRKCRGG